MKEFLTNCWRYHKIDEEGLQEMVTKTFITQEEYEEIVKIEKEPILL